MSDASSSWRDPFGLTGEDWTSLIHDAPELYTGPALLWFALAGQTIDGGPGSMTRGPLADLLTAVAGDACVLARLASWAPSEVLEELAPALDNLHRRIAATAEIAARWQPREMKDPREQPPRKNPPSPPYPSDPTRGCGS